MARPMRAMLPSSILVVVLLFQVADSSRPSLLSTEEQRARADPTAPAAAVVHRAEPHHQLAAAETGAGRVVVVETTTEDDGSRADAEPFSSATTTITADSAVRSRNGRLAATAVQQVLLRFMLARRFLAGEVEGGADSAAKPSCRSSDVHIGCTPASEH